LVSQPQSRLNLELPYSFREPRKWKAIETRAAYKVVYEVLVSSGEREKWVGVCV
jgi:hypothetical protein